MLHRCEVCGRRYRSPGWLARHMERAHAPGTAEGEQAGREPSLEPGPLFAEVDRVESQLGKACRALGIAASDVMSYRVYSDRVAIIEGPVGYKRVYEVGEER